MPVLALYLEISVDIGDKEIKECAASIMQVLQFQKTLNVNAKPSIFIIFLHDKISLSKTLDILGIPKIRHL